MLADASRYGPTPEREAEAAPRLFWQAPVALGAALGAETGPADIGVAPYVNHGRWVVECPDCHGAQLASRTDRRFMCNYCANVVVGGLWRPVLWPTAKQIGEIEGALAHRRPDNANWSPGEMVTDLLAENAARGVG